MNAFRWLRFVLVVSVSLLVASPVNARRTEWTYDKEYTEDRPHQVDVLGFVWPFGSTTRVGAAGWYGLPILDKGFIPLNDSLYIEVGGFLVWIQFDVGRESLTYVALVPAGGARWNLHLTDDWTIFLTAKLGFRLGLGADADQNVLIPSLSLGAIWEMSKSMFLRMETGNYGVVQVGVCFPF